MRGMAEDLQLAEWLMNEVLFFSFKLKGKSENKNKKN